MKPRLKPLTEKGWNKDRRAGLVGFGCLTVHSSYEEVLQADIDKTGNATHFRLHTRDYKDRYWRVMRWDYL